MGMKQFTFTLCAVCIAGGLFADPAKPAKPDVEPSLMEEGARLFLKGLQQQMEPALDGLSGLAADMEPALRGFITEMGPSLRDLMGKVEDWSLYYPPEILPNGDIILRKKQPETLKFSAPRQDGEADI